MDSIHSAAALRERCSASRHRVRADEGNLHEGHIDSSHCKPLPLHGS